MTSLALDSFNKEGRHSMSKSRPFCRYKRETTRIGGRSCRSASSFRKQGFFAGFFSGLWRNGIDGVRDRRVFWRGSQLLSSIPLRMPRRSAPVGQASLQSVTELLGPDLLSISRADGRYLVRMLNASFEQIHRTVAFKTIDSPKTFGKPGPNKCSKEQMP